MRPGHCYAPDGTAVDATEEECGVYGACCVAGACAYRVELADCLAGTWEWTSLVWHGFPTILAEALIGWNKDTGASETYEYDLIFNTGDWLSLWDPHNPPLGTNSLDPPATIDVNNRVPNQPGYLFSPHPRGWDMWGIGQKIYSPEIGDVSAAAFSRCPIQDRLCIRHA